MHHPFLQRLSLGLLLLMCAVLISQCARPQSSSVATTAVPTALPIPSPTTAVSEPPPSVIATEPTVATVSSPVATPSTQQSAMLEPCAAATLLRVVQTAVPTTPKPTTTPAPNPTAAPPTNTPRPAPSEDRVGFPEDYQNQYKLLFLFDRPDNKQVRVICGNDKAASTPMGQPFPYGSVLVMETYRAKQNAEGKPILDDKGQYIREALTGIFVMRKEQGFGTAYESNRSGEWEYVAYRANKEHLIVSKNTANCAACHLNQAGDAHDYVFRIAMLYEQGTAPTAQPSTPNQVLISLYAYYPAALTIKVGTTVNWINQDEAEHTITAKDGSFSSETLKSSLVKQGETFSHTFDKVGSFEYICAIHPAMKANVVVEE